MRKLPKPTDNPVEVFRTCISLVRNRSLKRCLESIETDIGTAANMFERAAIVASLHTLLPHAIAGGVVTNDEMVKVYTQRMAKKGAPGRPVYESLLSAPVHGKCPLCGQRTVSTLDHHLPKQYHPALAVVPANLIPACSDCNKVKMNDLPSIAEEQTLHPYYDDVETDEWLFAEVIEVAPASLRFFVNPPITWDHVKANRVSNHFKVLKLANLYASHSAEELSNILYMVKLYFSNGGREAVRRYLEETARSREAAYVNSWQTAMYKALSTNDWYCGGGFE